MKNNFFLIVLLFILSPLAKHAAPVANVFGDIPVSNVLCEDFFDETHPELELAIEDEAPEQENMNSNCCLDWDASDFFLPQSAQSFDFAAAQKWIFVAAPPCMRCAFLMQPPPRR